MRLLAAVSLAISLMAAAVHGQRPEFEVATVKLSPPVPLGRPIGINLGTFRNGTLTLTNVTLSECVQFAYSLVFQDQVIGPDWINSAKRDSTSSQRPQPARTWKVRAACCAGCSRSV